MLIQWLAKRKQRLEDLRWQQQQFVSGIRDVYGKGMTDILAQTEQQRTKALSTVKDLIDECNLKLYKLKVINKGLEWPTDFGLNK